MGIGNFIPKIWASTFLIPLQARLTAQAIATTEYQGSVSAMGDTVVINEVGPVTVRDYTRNSTSAITTERLSDAQKQLQIDSAKYFSFEVDDADAVQATPDVMGGAMRNAAYGVAKTIDSSLLALWTEAGINIGSTGTGINISSTNVLSRVQEMMSRLDQANCPEDGRFAIVPPWMWQHMTTAGINKVTENTQLFENGFRGVFAGARIYSTSQVVNSNFTDGARVMAGYSGTLAAVTQLGQVEALRSADSFADEVRGLTLYGVKVVRPDTLCVLHADYTADTT